MELSINSSDTQAISETLLWYKDPASDFNQALPIGNGRIGAMVFGGKNSETILINEDSLWSGGKRNRLNPDSLQGFKEVRKLLLEGNMSEAENVAFKKMQGVCPDSRHYMPLGELHIDMSLDSRPKDYKRSLDLQKAIASTEFSVGDVHFSRDVFVSAPDNVLVVRICADSPSAVSFSCRIDGCDDAFDDNRPCASNMLKLTGGYGGKNGIMFAAVLGASTIGGSVKTVGSTLQIQNADEALIILSAQTSFYKGFDAYEAAAELDAEYALDSSFDELYYRHVQDYSALFNRVKFSLNDNKDCDNSLDTSERIMRLRGNELDDKECQRHITDNKLAELYFNYGRYLMISASRPDCQPMNLQGIWNHDVHPVWGSRYTVNINTQMNYWCAETCNLSECHLPLFDLIERIRSDGSVTAKQMYGCEGFVCHHGSDIWGDTAPQGLWTQASLWPMGAAWLCLHIFEHYQFTCDKDFLEQKYDTLCDAAKFFVGYLTQNSDGFLITGPSVSPENSFISENGDKSALCMAPAMDSQILTVLFDDVIKSAEILGKSDKLIDTIRDMRKKLPPIKIGRYGQIMEWDSDYEEVDTGHRHISQLFALYPASLISPYDTPKLADAARATLVRRLIHGSGHTGWSCAWISSMWARLLDGRMVYENIQKLLAYYTNPNLLDSHPPFQIDGNFGGTAAIAEAVIQSGDGIINLLPALPDEWNSGYLCGIKAKGGFEVSVYWSDGKLISASVKSSVGGLCRIRANAVVSVCHENSKTVNSSINDDVISFDTAPDSIYIIK